MNTKLDADQDDNRRDAERYRHIRNQSGLPLPEEFDRLIDADMKKPVKEGYVIFRTEGSVNHAMWWRPGHSSFPPGRAAPIPATETPIPPSTRDPGPHPD